MKRTGILIFVSCSIAIVALVFASHILWHGSVPRGVFEKSVIKVGDELGFEPTFELTIPFYADDLPFFDRLQWKMTHHENEEKIKLGLDSQNLRHEFSFTNKSGADVRIDAYEATNEVFLVTLHRRFGTETLDDWCSSLRSNFPSLRILTR